MKYDYDIAVIGGGTAGLVTASGCARLGRRVAAKHDDPGKFRRLGIDVITGEAAFVSPRAIRVGDRWLRTTASRIWACGDVHGGPQFTHVAAHEAVTLVRNMLFPGKSAVDYANIPTAVYTDPELARRIARWSS